MTPAVSPVAAPPSAREKVLLVAATGWGPSFGGINAFNLDFCLALGRLLKGAARVVCLTTSVDDTTRTAAREKGVEILALPGVWSGDPGATVQAARELLRRAGIERLDLTIGHDVFTGPVATSLRTLLGGTAAVIHHMSYGSYQAVKADGQIAHQKEEEQRCVLREADIVLAVGPLLRGSAEELCQRANAVRMIVPGLAEIEPVVNREGMFRAIAFGRMGDEDDRIKQGRLAAAGYGRFVPQVIKLGLSHLLRLNVFGLSEAKYAEEQEALKKLVETHAGRVVNVVACPYTQNRQELFNHLARNEVAMMLSWHEGFGLVGWEAIAAKVPLLVSRASGLYLLLSDDPETLGADCVTAVDVRGSDEDMPREEDLAGVADALVQIAVNLPRALARAEKLKTHLHARYTWDGCARATLEACGLESLFPPDLTSAGKTPSHGGFAALQTKGALGEVAAGQDTLPDPQSQGLVVRAVELPGLIRRALRVSNVPQANILSAELDKVLGSVNPRLVPADKLLDCYLALYDLEAAKVAGLAPVPPQSVRRMKDLLEKAKNVPRN
jgi:glycosyltransferase involved in cell wall biosynthesis